ncbi:chemotaxis response regulator protein-glutamate methylesterase [Pullulanibacillus camelliae]|uniref:Protein-glutamate methylesterase/protein-glutamine glutaminase n=1 Tax=Pullulanibacillus camelliae TaxID=1707096 RepID=A0A8J2YIW0_9BACL|nr:chemotaxis response regulator protein-glutamate methylesterase [Pullulanibacillus camelliae]GGE46362.1 chemotaxis response regulator protein-glutamate methylesterase [Pullulanibacillus camelliae]
MEPIRVLVVDDSAFMRKLISEMINEDPRMTVVSTARDGEDALKKIKASAPDVVTLDVNLPKLNGLEVIERVMAEHPVPIILLSSLTDKGARVTIEAMALGAMDFVTKPSGEISLDIHKVKESLITKILNAGQISVQQAANTVDEHVVQPLIEQKRDTALQLICIGASTGGPKALRAVLSKLPSDLPVPIIVVQHMPPAFTHSLAQKLNEWSPAIVKEAAHGELLQKGTIYIAPGGFQTRIQTVGRSLAFYIDKSPAVRGLRPCYNVLLESVAEHKLDSVLTVTLTGMGSDGADGLKALKKVSRVYAIAESEATSVIFGMPKAAIQTGLVNEIVNLDDISSAIIKQINKGGIS